METLVVALVAFGVGCIVLAVVQGRSPRERYKEEELQAQLRENTSRVTQETLKRSSATLKGQIGERFAPFVPGFGYEAAGACFLGSPIDYVVFDGNSDGEIREIAFVEVKTGSLPLTNFQKQVKRAIEEQRVTWRVVELPDQ